MDTINSEFRCEKEFHVTDAMKDAFDKNGYILIRGFLDSEEVSMLKGDIEGDATLSENYLVRADGEGTFPKTTIWNNPGNDVTGRLVRSEKCAGSMETLLEGEIYSYHIKVNTKEPFTGGSFVWHQDYGYWYEDGCILPTMGTIFIACDRSDRTNGCLKVVPRSHLIGRIDPVASGDQVGADMARVQYAMERFGVLEVEMDAGDALFFHSNVLHQSDANRGPNRRMVFLAAYNRADNSPGFDVTGASCKYTPLIKVPNLAIKEGGMTREKKFFRSTDSKTSLSAIASIREKQKHK